MNPNRHALAGKTITIASGSLAGMEFTVQDWFHKVTGFSWQAGTDLPAVEVYAWSSKKEGLPRDNQVLLGHDRHGDAHLVHESQIGAKLRLVVDGEVSLDDWTFEAELTEPKGAARMRFELVSIVKPRGRDKFLCSLFCPASGIRQRQVLSIFTVFQIKPKVKQ